MGIIKIYGAKLGYDTEELIVKEESTREKLFVV
jgi:hypothetical protein